MRHFKTLQAVVATLFLLMALFSVHGGSVIQKIQETKNSIVRVKAENAQAAGGKKAAFRDENGRIFIMKQVSGAQYKRTGSGVIINSDGLIATNAHTVRGAGRVRVIYENGQESPASIKWMADNDDTAFIQPEDKPSGASPPITFSDSDAVNLGLSVYTVGSSELLTGTLSEGKITGIGKSLSRQKKEEGLNDLLQTSFNVYPGDSGGPILDKNGGFLGLIVATENSANHLSFAVPSNKIRKHYSAYLANIGKENNPATPGRTLN